ncbi:MAG: transcription antitermination factor NusB [Chloroflexi bacterium RBG_19FT_COMBO_48_23]|nr:MAG: transcription antitermination factor NusB [Chloroflexi bacterium RBG_19FT_COMBO_48_23]
MTGFRRQARTIAMQALYELDCSAHKPKDVLARLLEEKALPDEAADFAESLVNGILQNKENIDDVIRRFAPAFPVNQIAPIDRNILRLAIFEILFDNRVPMKAAINEAVELAKSFGGDTSQKFVNGVLGSVVTTCIQQGKQQ